MEGVTEAVMSVIPLAMVGTLAAECMADTMVEDTAGVIIPLGIMAAGTGGVGIHTGTVDGMADIPIPHIMGMAAVTEPFRGTGKAVGTHTRKVT